MNETLFYVFGIALVLSALTVAFVGLRVEGFPATRLALAGVVAYFTDQLEAKSGNVTIDFDNPSPLTHDVCLEGSSGEIGCSDMIAQGAASLSEDLKPGKYTFYCSVDGHRAAGMEGTLTVK